MGKLSSPAPQHAGADHVVSLLRRVRLDWLLQHFPPRLVQSVYVFVNGFLTIGVLALLALVSRNPFVFPSLGPTAYLLFFSPLAKTSSPRNTIFGHAIGLICDYAAFVATGAGAPTVRCSRRYLLAKNPGGGSFAVSHGGIHGSSRC